MSKRYFWLKLRDDFFRSKEIKKLRRIAGGDTYTVIYLKMMLLSLSDGGKLYFDGVEDTFWEELALEIDEDETNVQVTVSFLLNVGLMEMVDEDTAFLTAIPEMVGSETDKAALMRKKRHRDKQNKAIESNGVTNVGNNVTKDGNNVTKALPDVTFCYADIEKEIDIDKEQDIHCASDDAPHTNAVKPSDNTKQDNPAKPRKREVDEHFDAMWAMYPCKRGKNQVSDKHKRQLMAVRLEDMRKAIDRYVAEREAEDRPWLNGSTWFKGRYLDYINDDYEPPKVTCGLKPSARSQVTQFRAAGEEFDYRALEE